MVVKCRLPICGSRAAGLRARCSDRWAAGISPYPYAFIFPQDEHERLLIDRLSDAGVTVERETEFVGLEERADGILARLKRADGRLDFCEAAFVAGCDGASLASPRGVVDRFCGRDLRAPLLRRGCRGARTVMNGDIHVALDRTDFLAVFPLTDAHRARLVGTVRRGGGGSPAREPDLG